MSLSGVDHAPIQSGDVSPSGMIKNEEGTLDKRQQMLA